MRAEKSAGVHSGTEALALGGLTEALPTGWDEQAITARRNAVEGGTAKSLDTEFDQDRLPNTSVGAVSIRRKRAGTR